MTPTPTLLIPDLFAFWLTGLMVAERTNTSTPGLLRVAAAGVSLRAAPLVLISFARPRPRAQKRAL